jgi:hypothetical protein
MAEDMLLLAVGPDNGRLRQDRLPMAVRAGVDAARKYLETPRLGGDASSASHPPAEWLHLAAVEQASGRLVTAVAGLLRPASRVAAVTPNRMVVRTQNRMLTR